MAAVLDKPNLLSVTPEGIPLKLRAQARWAPWKAVWNAAKQKYEKVPMRADRIGKGLSSASTAGWTSFERAIAAAVERPDLFAGVGYLLTGVPIPDTNPQRYEPHAISAVDLDHCVVDGVIKPWAAEVVEKLGSYAEISPSGNGLRILMDGESYHEWPNHDQGVEMYNGTVPRFVTITGARLPSAPPAMRPPQHAVLDNMAARWRKSKTDWEIADSEPPGLVPEALMGELHEYELSSRTLNFLTEGPSSRDHSQEMYVACIDMSQHGMPRDEIFTRLAENEHALAIAERHWPGSHEKALKYLWKHSAGAGEAKAKAIEQENLDVFETIEEVEQRQAKAATADVANDFDILDEDDEGIRGRDLAPVVASEEKKKRFALLTPEQFLNRKPAEWLVRDLLPRAGLAVVYGDSGSGKSFFMLDVTMCVARGAEWRGRPVPQGKVVYVVAEGATGFAKRYQAYCQHNGLSPNDVPIRFLATPFGLTTAAEVTELLEELQAFGRLAMVVVDTYARVMNGKNENDATDVGEAVKQCDKIHRGTGALVVLVHHSGKNADKGARGSGALRAAADAEIQVSKHGNVRAATVTKMKDGADDSEFQFKLVETTIGQDEEGFDITSCVVEQRENAAKPPATSGKPLKPVQRLVLDTLDRLMDLDEGAVHREALRHAVIEILPRDTSKVRDNRPRDVKEAIDALIKGEHLEQDEQGNLTRNQ